LNVRPGHLPFASVDSFATHVGVKENPVRGADFERGKFSGERPIEITALMRERRGGILPPGSY